MSNTFPMTVASISLDHKGGTKSYHLTVIVPAHGKSLLIKRWGKKGAFGEVKIEQYPTKEECEQAFFKVFQEKTSGRKGYFQANNTDEEASDLDEARRLVGRPTWMKLSPSDLAHIDPSIDTTGVRNTPDPRYDEDGNWLGNPEPLKADLSEAIERTKQETIAEKRARNPLFGRF